MNKFELLMINKDIKYKIRFNSLESLENYLNKKLQKFNIKWYFETVFEKLNLLNNHQYTELNLIDGENE